MEVVSITDDWTIELSTPACDLKWSCCSRSAATAFRVHGCAFYFACESCYDRMMDRLVISFERFESLKCANCGLRYSLENYFSVIPL